MINIQERRVAASAASLGTRLSDIASSGDRVWPSPAWPRLRLDAGLVPGSRGGHGLVRYSVAEYEPGCRVRFVFDPTKGLVGYHELLIVPEGQGCCRLVHTVVGRCHGGMRILWPLVIRWLHEALVQDLFDNMELLATGRSPAQPARWNPWVRLLRRARGLPLQAPVQSPARWLVPATSMAAQCIAPPGGEQGREIHVRGL